jgi:hypothetical protein
MATLGCRFLCVATLRNGRVGVVITPETWGISSVSESGSFNIYNFKVGGGKIFFRKKSGFSGKIPIFF